MPGEKKSEVVSNPPEKTIIQTADSNFAIRDLPASQPLPVTPKLKEPNGVYQTFFSNSKMEQTVSFHSNHTYRLQERYIKNEKKDSIVMINGHWTPSNGYIWLYKDQIVRGRYSWKGDTLQYFSPLQKKHFTMYPLKDILENAVWKKRGEESIVAFGIGNEPFWNIKLTNKDSLSFLLSEWSHPVTIKISSFKTTKDSSYYIAQNDSTALRLTVLPFFCSDGMSDFVYSSKVRVQYNNHVYNGCGILYK